MGRSGTRSGTPRERGSGGTAPPARKPWSAEGDLPRWLTDELARVTPKQNLGAATELLQSAARAFSAGRYGRALGDAQRAKELAPRDATIREVMGLAAYRLGSWELALRELKTFRRLTGDSTHMPVEMDVLRALDRAGDVESTWTAFGRIGGDKATRNEARVVYGSFLLDRGEDRRAWEITGPKQLRSDPDEADLRVWYVAARAAHRLGDRATARRIYQAIERADAAFPGLDDLDRITQS
jgi:tetratricopeptide (TPR) repeat protein